MRLLSTFALLLGVILPAFTTSLAAQAAMNGIVREDSSGRPLEGVEVLINGTAHRVVTGANGRYQLEGLQPGIFQVIFRTVGHIPVRMDVLLTAGETTRANATLVRSDVVLDPIVVTGEPLAEVGLAGPGFEERRQMGFGRFVLPEELRRSEHLTLVDVLRRHGTTIMPVETREGTKWIPMNSTRRNRSGQLECQMAVFLDGVMIGEGGRPGASSPPAIDLRKEVAVGYLVAIEIYQRVSSIPMQFGGAKSGCGVIALWSRRAP